MGINFTGSVNVDGQTIEVGQNGIAFDKRAGDEPMTATLTVTRAGPNERREGIEVALRFTLDDFRKALDTDEERTAAVKELLVQSLIGDWRSGTFVLAYANKAFTLLRSN